MDVHNELIIRRSRNGKANIAAIIPTYHILSLYAV